jgi:L-alanine-DL-glutamate epimerase-like enolase superfamily enzyme
MSLRSTPDSLAQIHVPAGADAPPIERVTARSYTVPTDQPEADGTMSWSSTTVVTVEIEAGGVTGLGWTYGAAACRAVVAGELAETVVGRSPLGVAGTHEAIVRRCRNLGRPGVAASAISATDIASWDLKARLLGVSLADLFGRCRDSVPVYGSGGFTTTTNTPRPPSSSIGPPTSESGG